MPDFHSTGTQTPRRISFGNRGERAAANTSKAILVQLACRWESGRLTVVGRLAGLGTIAGSLPKHADSVTTQRQGAKRRFLSRWSSLYSSDSNKSNFVFLTSILNRKALRSVWSRASQVSTSRSRCVREAFWARASRPYVRF
jgi:hypothetical protein